MQTLHHFEVTPKDLTFQTKISDSIWREHEITVGISDFVEAIISKMSTIATDKSDILLFNVLTTLVIYCESCSILIKGNRLQYVQRKVFMESLVLS